MSIGITEDEPPSAPFEKMAISHLENLPPANEPPRLPHELIEQIASQLVADRAYGTIASLCAASKETYYVARPYLYRRFYLDGRSSHFLLQLVRHLLAPSSDLAQPLLYDSLTASINGDSTSPPFTSVLERTNLIEEIIMEDMPVTSVKQALDRLVLTHSPKLVPRDIPLLDQVFTKLRSFAFVEGFVRQWTKAEDIRKIETVVQLLGLFLRPEYICVQYPNITTDQFNDELEDFSVISSPWVVSNIVCGFVEARPATAPPIKSISIHNFRFGCPPPFDGIEGIKYVDTYYATPDEPSPGSDNSNFKHNIAERCERFDDLALILASGAGGGPSYRFHRPLSHERVEWLRKQDETISLVVGVDTSGSDEQVAWDVWTNRTRKKYDSAYPETSPKYENSPYRWSRFKKIVDEKFEFCPKPKEGAICRHCGAAL